MAIAVYGATVGSPTHPAVFAARLHLVGVGAAIAWSAAIALTWLTISRKQQ